MSDSDSPGPDDSGSGSALPPPPGWGPPPPPPPGSGPPPPLAASGPAYPLPPGSGAAGFVRQPPIDGFAIAALVFGIIGGILLGVVFGIVGLVRTKGGRRRGRGFAIAGLVLSALWAVLVVVIVVLVVTGQPTRDQGGEVTSGGRESFAAVRVGDCLTDLADGVESGVDVVPCEQPHDGQVFAKFDLPDGPYPGEDRALTLGEAGCRDRVPSQWQDSPQTADLGTFLYVPRESNWRAGDREVICAALSDRPLTASLPGLQS